MPAKEQCKNVKKILRMRGKKSNFILDIVSKFDIIKKF